MSSAPHSPEKRTTPEAVLHSIAVITSQRDRDLLAQALVNTLIEQVNSERITLYRILSGEHGEEAILMAEAHTRTDSTSPNRATSLLVAQREDFKTVWNSGKALEHQAEDNIYLSVHPITGLHGIVGLLEIVSDRHPLRSSHLVTAFLQVYSNYLCLLDESETDTLTGLLNRRTFDTNIEKIIAERSAADEVKPGTAQQHPARRMEGAELPHWLAIIDIDHFKRVNDQFGHLYGDEVLLLLSRIMRRIFRQRDKLFRFGGEEFVVVLDRASEENAEAVLERFRTAIEQYHFPQLEKITISIGFVRLAKAEVPSAIIGRADQALYYAKQHGRNRICRYEDLVSTGQLAAEHYSDDLQLF